MNSYVNINITPGSIESNNEFSLSQIEGAETTNPPPPSIDEMLGEVGSNLAETEAGAPPPPSVESVFDASASMLPPPPEVSTIGFSPDMIADDVPPPPNQLEAVESAIGAELPLPPELDGETEAAPNAEEDKPGSSKK